MKAQSADYIELQNIYKAKARSDLAKVVDRVRQIEGEYQRESPVAEKEIEAFCKGAAFIKLIRGQRLLPPLSTIWDEREANAKMLCKELLDPNSLLRIHVSFLYYDRLMALRMPERLYATFNPDDLHATWEKRRKYLEGNTPFSPKFWIRSNALKLFIINKGISVPLAELARAKGAELHNISASTGGMVAQEIIKVITKQYIPIDSTCVFDGVRSKAGVFRRYGELGTELHIDEFIYD